MCELQRATRENQSHWGFPHPTSKCFSPAGTSTREGEQLRVKTSRRQFVISNAFYPLSEARINVLPDAALGVQFLWPGLSCDGEAHAFYTSAAGSDTSHP